MRFGALPSALPILQSVVLEQKAMDATGGLTLLGCPRKLVNG